VTKARTSSLLCEQHLSDGTRVYTTRPDLDAPIAQIHCVFALPSAQPNIPGEIPVLLEWMQRGTAKRSRSEIFDAFGALGIEPQLSMLQSGVLFSIQCLDACRDLALAYVRELLYQPAFDADELADVFEELDEDDSACRDDPEQISYRAQRLARWHGTTLSAPVNGTRRTRAQLDEKYLRALHQEVFSRPAILGIASERSDAWVQSLSGALISDRPVRTHDYTPPSLDTIDAKPRNISVHAPTLEHAIVVCYSPGPQDQDPQQLAASFLHHEALTEGMSAPLMMQLRGQQALSYAVSSQLIDRGTGWDQCFEIEPSPERVTEAIDAARALWTRTELLTEEDFRRAWIGFETQERLQTIDARRALSHALRQEILWNRSLDWRANHVDALRKVQPHEAMARGTHYGMSQDPLCTIVIAKRGRLSAPWNQEIFELDDLFDGWAL